MCAPRTPTFLALADEERGELAVCVLVHEVGGHPDAKAAVEEDS